LALAAFRLLSDPALETLLLALDRSGGPMGEALFVHARDHPGLGDWEGLTGWQPFKPQAQAWDIAGRRRVIELPVGKWPMVLLLPGKSRDEVLHSFATAWDRVAEGGHLVVAMSNDEGAARFEKELSRAAGGVESIQKNKCRAFWFKAGGARDETLLNEWRQLGEMRRVEGTEFFTQAGVFSHGRIDAGSGLLVRHLPKGLTGRVADLGAGWGFLADAVLSTSPGLGGIDLYEADLRALDCARLNLARHGEREIGFHWHDVTTGIAPGYDVVIMNPPFHRGTETDVDLGRDFLRAGAAALRRGGRMFLVANRQLPYEAVLDELRLPWRKLAEDATYKVLSATGR
jgi:16S rRNA (guanine1207-N2)-methyltransferase